MRALLRASLPAPAPAPAPALPSPPPPAVAVPAELAAFFAAQNVAEHGPRLVGEHRLSFLGDLRFLDEGDLVASGLTKVEARRLLAAAAKLGASQRIVSDKPGGAPGGSPCSCGAM